MTFGFLSHLDYNLWLFRLPIMQELVHQRHTVYAVCPSGEISGFFSEHGITHIPYQIERSSLNPIKELDAIRNIYNAIKPLNLDILHTFTAKPNIYGTVAGRLAKVPRIINLVEGLGSFYLENDLKSRLIRNMIEILYRQSFKLADTVMFVNQDDPAYLIDKKVINAAKVVTIKGVGIDTKEWLPASKIPSEKIVITMVARALIHKGTLEYIAAADRLKPLYPNIEFRYIGAPDPGNSSSLSETFMQEQRNITYMGHRDDVHDQLAKSDIFILPSYREGLPRTSMEALSMGLPIVTTDVVGCRETIDEGVNGFLVPSKNAIALADAIESLILNSDLRRTMGEKSRIKALKEFDVATIVAKHLEVYGLKRVH
jgi:N,N'-diacetylbacillosaminyl-diphospho-undecaprenol alpha-1,3-N-acetylgalactosaminyltransferase